MGRSYVGRKHFSAKLWLVAIFGPTVECESHFLNCHKMGNFWDVSFLAPLLALPRRGLEVVVKSTPQERFYVWWGFVFEGSNLT